MPRGHPTSSEKIEQARALAQTSLTEERIASKVGISRRTLGRIWAKAGIRRGTEQQEGSKPISVVTTTVPETPFDPVQTARKKEHSDYLREQFKCLAAHIYVPAPGSVYYGTVQQKETFHGLILLHLDLEAQCNGGSPM